MRDTTFNFIGGIIDRLKYGIWPLKRYYQIQEEAELAQRRIEQLEHQFRDAQDQVDLCCTDRRNGLREIARLMGKSVANDSRIRLLERENSNLKKNSGRGVYNDNSC